MRAWRLTAAQRRTLEGELARAQDAALFRRILALLEVDEGRAVGEVAKQLRVDRRSVQRWIARYGRQAHVEGLRHQPGQGRPLRWDPALEARLKVALSQRPTDFGYAATAWTVPLLQHWLAGDRPEPRLSAATLRRRLRERDYVWKRFRYVLNPDPQREKKTPHPPPNTGLGRRAQRAPGSGRNRLAALAAPAGGLGAPGPTGARAPQRPKRPAHRLRQPEPADRPRAAFGPAA
jgi:transposase